MKFKKRGGNKIKDQGDVLIFDVETSSPHDISHPDYRSTATVKWFGAYSFKDQQYYFFDYKEKESIQKLINDHKIVVGYNSKSFDLVVCENKINQFNFDYKIKIDLMRVLFVPEVRKSVRESIIKVKGRILKDLLKNHKLKHVGEVLGLSVEKGDIDFRILHKMSWTKEEVNDILKYLWKDLVLTKEMFEYFYEEFLPMKSFMSEDDQRKYNWYRTSTGSYTYKVVCYQAGIPEKYPEDDERQYKKYEGGYVAMPIKESHSGKIYLLDFTSAYPHAFMMGNLYSHSCSCCEEHEKWKGNSLFPVKGNYCQKQMGKIEKVIEKLYNLRLEYKKNKDPREFAVKVLINTLYGISGSSTFKSLYSITTAADCTLMARQMIKHARTRFNEVGYELIYTDTDSVYLRDPFNDESKLLRVRDTIIDDIKSNVPFIKNTFNMIIDDRIKAIWFFTDDHGEFKKKNYIYITEKNNIEMKGIALIKSDCSRLAKIVYSRLKPLIKKNTNIKFDRMFVEEIVMELIKEDLRLVERYIKVEKGCIRAEAVFNIKSQTLMARGNIGLCLIIG